MFYNTDDAINLFIMKTGCSKLQAQQFINLTDVFESMCGVSGRYPELVIADYKNGVVGEEKREIFISLVSGMPNGLVQKLIDAEYDYLASIGCISNKEYQECKKEACV